MIKESAQVRVWVDFREKPRSALIWDLVNTFLYLVGDSNNKNFNSGIQKTIKEIIIPKFLEWKIKKIYFFTSTIEWEKQIQLLFNESEFNKHIMRHYIYNKKNYNLIKNWQEKIPSHFNIKRITKEFLENEKFTNNEEVTYCVIALWQTIERYDKESIGFCLRDKQAIAAWCTTDYIVENDCELYIETFNGFKRKGYATLVASATIEECLKRNYTIHWHCWETHISSVKTAVKIGFELKNQDPVLSLTL